MFELNPRIPINQSTPRPFISSDPNTSASRETETEIIDTGQRIGLRACASWSDPTIGATTTVLLGVHHPREQASSHQQAKCVVNAGLAWDCFPILLHASERARWPVTPYYSRITRRHLRIPKTTREGSDAVARLTCTQPIEVDEVDPRLGFLHVFSHT
jgi:hypothetical protein